MDVITRSYRHPTRDVALLVETSNEYARGILTGVRNYLTAHPNWSIYIGERSRQGGDMSWLDGWHGDGVLARIETEEVARRVRALGVPVVDLSATRLAPEFPCVETDDAAIAHWAIRHFTDRGLKNFAFCGDSRFRWSINRGARFAERIEELGGEPLSFDLSAGSRGARDNRERLIAWLRMLPKPVGVMACYDIAGQALLEACRVADIAVPDTVAVIGVDNDDLICNLTSPPMSSIQPDAARTGFLAAELLEKIMAGESVDHDIRLVAPLRVVARQSSDIFAIADPIVARALQFIRDHGEESVRVPDVTAHVNLSRRALDYRFRQQLGRTVHDEITRVRMSHVAELLAHTDWALPRIAERLGFPHSEYMSVAFRRQFGSSPGLYRRAIRGGR